jgi:hypothetical protein
MPDVKTGKGTVAAADGGRHRERSMLVDGVAKFSEFLCVGHFRCDRIFPGHGRKIGEQVRPQADAVRPHQWAALVAAQMIFETVHGIESGRADIQAGGVVPSVRILPAKAGLPPDRLKALRIAFDAVLKDPEFLDDIRKSKIDFDGPTDGVFIEKLIASFYATPKAVVDRVT